ncbi:protein kinase [uncultured Cohaesibacter sp.]|uniref:protein kinase domain-containing protein n=1 Tax=uncultured Cohaesibacter sp. TaxID=1002546 RepID=UPI003749B686
MCPEHCSGIGLLSHEQHLVHADIKPANVFICKNGQIKLIDFNIAFPIARLEAGDDHTARILGRYGAVTPLYSSPQRLAGEEPSKSDDIFSLATLAYIALTGERPFGDRNAREAKEQGLAPIKPGAIPAATWRVLEKALQFGDEARMQDIREFASAFAAKRTWSLF